MDTYTFSVPRPWEPSTLAIVTVTTDLAPTAVKHAVTATATAWATTASGKAATHGARTDGWAFNIGDLAGYQNDPELQKALRDHGISTLKIHTVSNDNMPQWEFDDPVLISDEEASS